MKILELNIIIGTHMKIELKEITVRELGGYKDNAEKVGWRWWRLEIRPQIKGNLL
jgi:hypothetical protein